MIVQSGAFITIDKEIITSIANPPNRSDAHMNQTYMFSPM